MRFLLVTSKKISSTQLKEFNKHYSVISVGKAHLKKSVHHLGHSDLVLLNLNFGLLHQPSKNEELKWVNDQDLSSFKVVYIYSKPKYMKSFVKANLILKRLPIIVGKTLEAVLSMSERLADGESSVSLTQEDLKTITEEINHEISPDDIIRIMGDYKQLQTDYAKLEQVCDKLRASADKILKEPDPPIFHQDNVSQLDAVIAKLAKPKLEDIKPVKHVKSLKHINKGIELLSDGVVIDILKFNNRREQREVKRQAMLWMRE